jgi:hypothetical protein
MLSLVSLVELSQHGSWLEQTDLGTGYTYPAFIHKLFHSDDDNLIHIDKVNLLSIGVLMWEVYTLGKLHYERLNNNEIVDKVSRGYRLYRPHLANDRVFTIQTSCWLDVRTVYRIMPGPRSVYSVFPTFMVIVKPNSTVLG